MTGLDAIDLSDHELFRRGFPHDTFALLREEAPVWRHPDTPGTERVGGGFWVVSRHADVQALSRDPVRFRSLEGPSIPDSPPERRMPMLGMDPPEHTRFRRLVSGGFTPRMTAKLEAQTRDWAVSIVERMLERGECEFVNEAAYRLPMHMIADIVGIPVSDRDALFDMVNVLLQATDPRSYLSEEERTAIEIEMFTYAHELGEQKRQNPTDDVWSLLTTVEIEQADGTSSRLDELELDMFFMVLLFGGSETTRNAISSGLLALVERPDQLERLRRDPELMPTAVEEIVRWVSPVAYFRRTVTEDVELHGAHLAAGDVVSLWFASANRDAEVFDDPFCFDVARDPNPHVGFGGGGVHYCLGANLAKREIKVMFEELVARVGEIEVVGEPEYSVQGIENPITVSLKDLRVRVTRR